MAGAELDPRDLTHEVTNQVPPLEGANLAAGDRALREGLEREGAAWAEEAVVGFGEVLAGEPARWAEQANRVTPLLRTHDRTGHRIDEVEYHPAYHELMRLAVAHGVHTLPWREERPGAHVARAGLFYALAQVEAGVGCPLSMTYSGVPALRAEPDVAAEWEPRLLSTEYDPRLVPADRKRGAICGMAMTEKQGGSDVRANTTQAHPLGGGEYELVGHKWFCSAPMSDAFLVLAQTERGITCFLLPRFRPDGSRNRFHVQRLKDKLGDRSNASSEVEFRGAWARRVGEEGRGVRTIIEMVNHTRLDCVIGSAATMRRAVAEAAHHTAHRSAFGKRLAEHALMQNVLADVCVESEAATATMLRLARGYDESREDSLQGRFVRIATAVCKYWVCKRTAPTVAEALECHGGNGYVEESILPRLYRQAPLNSIWEGSGNVICLDVLRAMVKTPETVDAFFGELALAEGADRRYDAAVGALQDELGRPEALEARARRVVERMAVTLQASLLLRHSDPAVADAFCASRLDRDWGTAFGTLPPGVDAVRILERARPEA